MRIFLTILLILAFINVDGQTLTGQVVDEDGGPIAFATVALVQLPDSAVVGGGVTDGEGRYAIESAVTGRILRVSCIGFQTQLCDAIEGQTIVMSPMDLIVEGVVVKGHRPTFKMEGKAFVAPVQGTVLSSIGEGMDVLRQLPFIVSDDNGIKVMGQRGKLLVYINKRKMQDWDELRQLSSSDIRDVRIEMNPGPKYDATVGVVIHVTTLRQVGEGFGGRVMAEGSQGKDFESRGLMRLNYRRGDVDIFGGVYLNNTVSRGNHEEVYQFHQGQKDYEASGEGKEHNKYSWLWMNAGFNYQPSERTYFSMQYIYDTDLKYSTHMDLDNTFSGGNDNSAFSSVTDGDRKRGHHKLTAYYSQKLSSRLNLTVDGAWARTYTDETGDEEENRSKAWLSFSSITSVRYDVYALKGNVSTALFGGVFDCGIEGTYTQSSQNYEVVRQSATDILGSSTESRQNMGSIFMSYQHSFGRIMADLGMRYEIADYRYYKDGVLLDDESRVFRHLFPSLTFSYNTDAWSASIGYSVKVSRPVYNDLQGGVKYTNSYLYYQGNPFLRPEYTHSYSLTASYRDFQLMVDFSHCADQSIKTLSMYGALPVVLSSTENIDVNYLTASLSWSPTIGRWNPSLSASFMKQYMDYLGRNYNQPIFTYSCKNVITLPREWQVVVNFEGHTQGNGNAYTTRAALLYDSDVFVSKKIGNWTLRVGANDLFHSFKDDGYEWHGDIFHRHWTDLNAQCVYVRATYRFNTAQSKYKGGTAGESEMNRF